MGEFWHVGPDGVDVKTFGEYVKVTHLSGWPVTLNGHLLEGAVVTNTDVLVLKCADEAFGAKVFVEAAEKLDGPHTVGGPPVEDTVAPGAKAVIDPDFEPPTQEDPTLVRPANVTPADFEALKEHDGSHGPQPGPEGGPGVKPGEFAKVNRKAAKAERDAAKSKK